MSIQYPLPNALVIVIREDKRWAFYGYTDENGRIEIKLPPGKYDIWVFKEKYSLHHQIEVISADKVKTISLKKMVIERVIVEPYILATGYPWNVLEAFYILITEKPHYWQEHKKLEEEIMAQAIPKYMPWIREHYIPLLKVYIRLEESWLFNVVKEEITLSEELQTS